MLISLLRSHMPETDGIRLVRGLVVEKPVGSLGIPLGWCLWCLHWHRSHPGSRSSPGRHATMSAPVGAKQAAADVPGGGQRAERLRARPTARRRAPPPTVFRGDFESEKTATGGEDRQERRKMKRA